MFWTTAFIEISVGWYKSRFFSSVSKSKELNYVLVKWRYMIPHIEGNEGGKFFLYRLGATSSFKNTL